MTDVDYLSPLNGENALAIHDIVLARAHEITGVVNGNRVTPTSPASMTLNIGSGRVRVSGIPYDVNATTVVIGASDNTLYRIDVLYRKADGSVATVAGSLTAKHDLGSSDNWHQYDAPLPSVSIPVGAILGSVIVPPGCSLLTAVNVWMFAAHVIDISNTIVAPGSSARPVSENAVVSYSATAARGVTDGDSHVHVGGAGGQVRHGDLSNIGSNAHSVIDSHLANTSNPHSTTKTQIGLSSVTDDAQLKASDAVTSIATPGLDTKFPSEKSIRSLIEALKQVQRNNAWNSSFEFFLGASACLGWWKIGTATIAQDTGLRDGYGGSLSIKITSAGTNNEGVSQTLKGLKASTTYTVRVCMQAATNNTCKLWTTGASDDLTLLSTSVAGEFKSGTFTTDATPTDVVLKLGSDTSGEIVWFDCITITEGTEIPDTYFKDAEWDSPKQIPIGVGSGDVVLSTGVISGSFKQAQDNYEIVGWKLAESTATPVSTTSTIDVLMNSTYSPGSGNSIAASAKPSISAGTYAESATLTGWTTLIPKGYWMGANLTINNNGKCFDLFLLVRRL